MFIIYRRDANSNTCGKRQKHILKEIYGFKRNRLTDDFINKILSVVVGGNPLPLGGGRSLVN